MRIRPNLSMLQLHNANNRIKGSQNKVLERLSSGFSINRAADDAAGFTIGEGMRAQIRGLERAWMNSQDAVSLVQTADGVVQEITQTVQRMRELTVQALNDTLTDSDRGQLQMEFRQLQESITTMSKHTKFNDSIPAVEMHSPSFGMLEGNRTFDKSVQIIAGWNDQLLLSAGGSEYPITLPEGNYPSIEELIDAIDTDIYSTYPDIIFDVTADNSVSVQIENMPDIVKVKGSGSFLFFDYEMGNPPGMIIGSTDFSTGDYKLYIQSGVNDVVTFYVGPTKMFDITLTPNSNGYTRDEIVQVINQQLSAQGEDSVKAEKFGEKYISITSDKYVITGLSGNMIKVDGVSSFLYDISGHGKVAKTNGYYYGRAFLNEGVTIEKGVNDELTINVNGAGNQTIHLLEDGETVESFSSPELLTRLNERFEALSLPVIASLSGNSLMLRSERYGNGSSVQVISSSNAYRDLFTREDTIYYSPTIVDGRKEIAQLIGNYDERTVTTFNEFNNTLVFNINGEEKEFEIPAGDYTIDEIITTLNYLIPDTISASYQTLNGKQSIRLSSDVVGTSIAFTNNSINSSAFQELFGGEYVYNPSIVDGKTKDPINPPEGEVGQPIIEKTAAIVVGQVDVSNGLVISEENNTISFKLDGLDYSVQLNNGNYTKEELLSILQANFSPFQPLYR